MCHSNFPGDECERLYKEEFNPPRARVVCIVRPDRVLRVLPIDGQDYQDESWRFVQKVLKPACSTNGRSSNSAFFCLTFLQSLSELVHFLSGGESAFNTDCASLFFIRTISPFTYFFISFLSAGGQ